MTRAVIATRGLTCRFGRNQVLRGVDLEVPEGSVTALLGRNGEGKSTLLRILIGFLPQDAGDARVLDLDPRRKGPELRSRVGYVPERLELPPWMSIADHLRFLRPFYPTWNDDEVARLVDRLGLDPSARIRDLSKGFRTKHLLLCALAHEPRLLLLDEPFSGLDPVLRGDVMGAVLDHLREDGRTVVLVSHSLVDVERVADRVALLDQGRIAFHDDLETVRARCARVAVTLVPGTDAWTPPGTPIVKRDGADVLLTYLDWSDTLADMLAADPAVLDARPLPRDLRDVFVARMEERRDESEAREEAPCATPSS